MNDPADIIRNPICFFIVQEESHHNLVKDTNLHDGWWRTCHPRRIIFIPTRLQFGPDKFIYFSSATYPRLMFLPCIGLLETAEDEAGKRQSHNCKDDERTKRFCSVVGLQ